MCYKKVADDKECYFFDVAQYIYPSKTDSLHLTPEGHERLAEELYKVILAIDNGDGTL